VAVEIKRILQDAEPASIKGRGRLDADVREVAARTQVPIDEFTECPNCGESMDNSFIHLDVDVGGVDFHCESCGKLGTIYDNGKIRYYNPNKNMKTGDSK